MKDYKLDFYTLPFSDYSECGRICDADNNFAFMFVPLLKDEQINKILVSLNSEEHKPLKYKEAITLNYVKEVGVINMNTKPFIIIRGWGNLTGVGGHNLSGERAVEIQNNLAEWIISKLT